MGWSVAGETDRSLAAAGHLTDADAGAVAVLRGLAAAVDWLLDHEGLTASGKLDNVSVPTYLRYCDALGLTPAGRLKLGEKPEESGGVLAELQARRRKVRPA